VMRMLNGYLGRMARLIAHHGGTIDEFIGDAILAIFGAPIAGNDDPERAVHCALAMQREMTEVNRAHARDGLPLLEMGIAVHTGEVVVGNIGSDIRAKYGVVGSNVNLTARIESLTIGGQILISDATRAAVASEIHLGPPVQFRAKGFARDTTVWELRGLRDEAESAEESQQDELPVLDPPLPLMFWPVQNNIVDGSAHEGFLVCAAGRRGVLKAAVPILPFSDIRILLRAQPGDATPQELWAKVRQTTPNGTHLQFSHSIWGQTSVELLSR
jgi:adenylate cyclase